MGPLWDWPMVVQGRLKVGSGLVWGVLLQGCFRVHLGRFFMGYWLAWGGG